MTGSDTQPSTSSQNTENQSSQERFNLRYESGETPWDLGRPDKDLLKFVQSTPLAPCRVLDIGCGAGYNAIWLQKAGFEATGLDFSAPALDQARNNAKAAGADIVFVQADFLKHTLSGSPFDFLFDRGCFHSFDRAQDRARFADNAHRHLAPQGIWLSFLGNADAPPRTEGPPMRTALEIVTAVEPYFEILMLKSHYFDSTRESPARNWQCLMKKRA